MSESSSSTCLSTWAVSLISLKPVVYSPHVWAEAGLRAACRWGRGRLRVAGLGTANGRGPWSFDPPRRGRQGAASGRSVAGGRPGDPLLLSRAVGFALSPAAAGNTFSTWPHQPGLRSRLWMFAKLIEKARKDFHHSFDLCFANYERN